MKKWLVVLLVVICGFNFVACNGISKEEAEEVLGLITISDQTTTEFDVYTKLIRDEKTFDISWTSSNENVLLISNVTKEVEGNTMVTVQVLKVSADTKVVLTATCGGASKEFETTVKGGSGTTLEPTDEAKHELNFTTLTPVTSYVKTPTATEVVDSVSGETFVFNRLNANINVYGDSGYSGIILGIRNGNSFQTPELALVTALSGVSKVYFSWYNWNRDFDYNYADFVDKIVVESSTDGTTWVESADLTDQVDTGTDAKNAFTVNLASGSKHIRIRFIARTDIDAIAHETHQLRAIFTDMKFYA